jgi:hypothetical protein
VALVKEVLGNQNDANISVMGPFINNPKFPWKRRLTERRGTVYRARFHSLPICSLSNGSSSSVRSKTVASNCALLAIAPDYSAVKIPHDTQSVEVLQGPIQNDLPESLGPLTIHER